MTTSSNRPQQLPAHFIPPTSPIDLTRLTPSQQAIYNCLRSQGWTDTHCTTWLRSTNHMQESLSGWFRAQGWSEKQLRAFRERCEGELPVGVAPPVTGSDGWQTEFDLQSKLLGEAGRRKRVGEEMGVGFGVGRRGSR
ncbi:hypothetical protein BDV37DRAFT_285731 [Aspergillus pseudonomiae]|uniref:Uncharacterized protein n=1 Tax=Aspergillus pseudonomiae TaxID=1506151 RepID=A0A5N7D4W3_9EURO|nr:uncharacterized protein BDV37DRAFT_285731 [Aspergillus pseudonomiae]KAE8401450.1 hypothetical protein BDV37DRAFT_285731 [Aspergillus pseudonomiae]